MTSSRWPDNVPQGTAPPLNSGGRPCATREACRDWHPSLPAASATGAVRRSWPAAAVLRKMADRRRQRASQDTEDEESGASGSDSGGSLARGGGSCSGSGGGGGSGSLPSQRVGRSGALHLRRMESGGAKSAEESECESEDGMEGDAVLSDYESAEDSEGEEGEYSEEENSKVELKSDTNDTANSSAKEEKGEDKADGKGAVTGERQSGDGQESTEPVENKVGKKGPKHLDDDEDRKNPAYIPRKGLFFEHDLRGQTQEEEIRPKGRQRKLWKDEGRWEHDKFREDEQAPKSRQELIALYGYDIRSAHNPDDIKPRRIRKPRYGSPPQRDPNWVGERTIKPHRHQGPGGTLPPRTFINRNAAGTGRMSTPRNYPRSGGFKEGRAGFRPVEAGGPHGRAGETVRHEAGYRSRRLDQVPVREPSPEADAPVPGSPEKEEAASETPPAAPDTAPPAPDRPIEKKSYSRARRTRTKAGDAGKAVEEMPPPPEGLTSAPPGPEAATTPSAKAGSWESPVDSTTGGLEQDVAQLSLEDQNWSPGQPSFLQPRELRGVPSHIHMGAGPPPQFNRMEEMGVQGGRAKRYSSQRQRPVPEPPAPPVHISIMEGHYYDPLQFQGAIYTHGDSPAPLAPQGMIVQPEMHLPHPGLHPHQTPAPLPNPGLYPPPVTMSPGQPPPQQLLAPTYFSAPGVMNFGNPSYPYAPGGLPPPPPPHLYPNTQVVSRGSS
ncbi:protein CASC3 isoform X2 [Heterocephalus glaber]|uniref:Protein CASC3 n=1 Tax=Heterocephalus glaber TaxID=10181 RepID=A0AAX6RJ45_HETGA|nr:protein CASC3 isoform X2 [Heterocephalus glaber]